jgi:hypothetical protein
MHIVGWTFAAIAIWDIILWMPDNLFTFDAGSDGARIALELEPLVEERV